MRLQPVIYEGQRIPFGYGYVRYDYARDARVFAPMPLNWIIRWALWLWLTALDKSIKPLTREELQNHERVHYEIERQRHHIIISEFSNGWRKGYEEGWRAHGEHLMTALEKKERGDADVELAEPEIESCPSCGGIMEHVTGCDRQDVAR